MELQLTLNCKQTAQEPYWTPILTGTLKLASPHWHLCCCFHFHWVIAGMLGLATLHLSHNEAQEFFTGVQGRSEGTVLFQLSKWPAPFFPSILFNLLFLVFYLLCIGSSMTRQSAKLVWNCWELWLDSPTTVLCQFSLLMSIQNSMWLKSWPTSKSCFSEKKL